jgi:hypothetical protein
MKKIILTITIDEQDKMGCKFDTYDGDGPNPIDYGRMAGVIVMAAAQLLHTMGDSYVKQERFAAAEDMMTAYASTVAEGPAAMKSRVSKEPFTEEL